MLHMTLSIPHLFSRLPWSNATNLFSHSIFGFLASPSLMYTFPFIQFFFFLWLFESYSSFLYCCHFYTTRTCNVCSRLKLCKILIGIRPWMLSLLHWKLMGHGPWLIYLLDVHRLVIVRSTRLSTSLIALLNITKIILLLKGYT